MSQSMILLYVALGGALGACSRFLLTELCLHWFGRGFAYGTLMVNVIGSLSIGILVAALEQEYFPHGPWRHLIGFGFLGALTTFSTFSMDNLLLLQQGLWLKLGINMFLNVFLCLFASWAGHQLLMR